MNNIKSVCILGTLNDYIQTVVEEDLERESLMTLFPGTINGLSAKIVEEKDELFLLGEDCKFKITNENGVLTYCSVPLYNEYSYDDLIIKECDKGNIVVNERGLEKEYIAYYKNEGNVVKINDNSSILEISYLLKLIFNKKVFIQKNPFKLMLIDDLSYITCPKLQLEFNKLIITK